MGDPASGFRLCGHDTNSLDLLYIWPKYSKKERILPSCLSAQRRADVEMVGEDQGLDDICYMIYAWDWFLVFHRTRWSLQK